MNLILNIVNTSMKSLNKNRRSHRTIQIVVFFIFLNLLAQLSFAEAQETKKTFTFGIVPQQSALVLAKKWIPILKALEKETGFKFIFKTDTSIPSFEQKLSKQAYDFAYMNPYHYTVFHEISGYDAFAKQANKKLTGIIVVAKKSPINSLEDLQGKTIVFPAPAAFAATVLPQVLLKHMGIEIKSKYVSSHESVYKNVNYGHFWAGGGIERTFKNTDNKITDNLRVLWVSKGYTPHAFASSPNVTDKDKIKVQQALLNLSFTTEGKALLDTISFKGIVTAKNVDWDDVRQLDIKLLDELKPVTTSLQ